MFDVSNTISKKVCGDEIFPILHHGDKKQHKVQKEIYHTCNGSRLLPPIQKYRKSLIEGLTLYGLGEMNAVVKSFWGALY